MPTALSFPTITGVTNAPNMPNLTEAANIQSALKLLYFGSTGGAVTSDGIYGALHRLYVGDPTLAGNVTITGTLTVNGGTTTINSTTITVDDKLLELGAVTTPTNITADGGGVLLKGATDKTILWDNANSNWTTSENWNLTTGKTLKINNVNIASGTGADLVLGANASSTLALGNTSGTTTLNGILSVNNPNRTMAHLMGYTSTVTSATPVSLSNTSSYYQQFTGSTAQTITLPVTSTLAQGWTFHIVNNNTPTGDLTVNSSGGNLVITVPPGTTAMVTCILNSGTTAASWESGLTDFSTYTGSGAVVMGTSPTITTPKIDSISTTTGAAATPALWSDVTTGTITAGSGLTTGTLTLGPTSTISSGTRTIALGTGVSNTVSATQNINIGTGAPTASGISNINIGATGSTTTVTGTFKVGVSTLAAGVSGIVTLPSSAGTLALNNQTFFIGSQSIAINQGTGTITSLPGVSSINGATLPSSGTIITSSSPTITTPTIDTINTSLTTTGTAALFNTGLTTGTISMGGALTTGTINIGTGTAGAKTIGIGTSTGTNTLNGTTNIANTLQLAGTSVTTTAAKLNYLTSATGTTGTSSTNVVFSTSPTLTTPLIDSISTTTGAAATPTLWSDVTTGTVGLANGLTTGTLNIATTAGAKTVNIGSSTGTVTINGTANIGKTLIATTTTAAGTNTFTFSSIPQTYKSLEVVYTTTTTQTSSGAVSITFGGSTAANYHYSYASYIGSTGTITTATTAGAAGSNQAAIVLPPVPTSGSGFSFSIDNYISTTGPKMGNVSGITSFSGSGVYGGAIGWGLTSTAITSMTFTIAGTVTGMVVVASLYGVN